jgi:competence protein ComEA
MKKILVMLALTLSFLSAINVQTASKDELMCIKGIGEKKAAAIMKYRKATKLKSVDDLINIKGFGKGLIKNVKKDVKSVACGGKKSAKSTKKTTKSDKKSTKLDKKSSKKDSSKKSTKSDKKTKKSSNSDKKTKKESKSEKKSSEKKAA